MKQTTLVAIDFGTTHTLMAYAPGKTIKWYNESDLLPSLVSFEGDQYHVGFDAYLNPLKSGLLASIKSMLTESDQYVYEKKTPIDLAAMVFEYIKQRAECMLEMHLSACILTVPPYFCSAGRSSLKQACENAGWSVLSMIEEPTAAACIMNNPGQTYIVCHCGGGSFDVSIVDGLFNVLATRSVIQLGGDNIDIALAGYFYQCKRVDYIRCRRFACQAKEEMAFRTLWSRDSVSLDRSEFEHITHSIIQNMLESLDETIRESGLCIKDINAIILAGGGARLWKLKEKIESHTGLLCIDHIDPDTVAVLGAISYANHSHTLKKAS